MLTLPVVLLGLAALRISHANTRLWLVLGGAIELIAVLWWTYGSPLGYRSAIFPVGIFSLLAAIWFWKCPDQSDWFISFAMSLLLLGPLLMLGVEFALHAGLPNLRQAHRLIRRLRRRRDWPKALSEIRFLPEVRLLREAVRQDALPVWSLLNHPHLTMRIAGLAALEFRPYWHPNQAEWLMRFLQPTHEPAMRAATIRALGDIDDPYLLDTFELCLRDPVHEVRQATAEVLLTRSEHLWPRFRQALHGVLSDPRFRKDGPLNEELPTLLPSHAVNDLLGWAGESGPIAARATMTLITHFRRMLQENPSREVIDRLSQSMLNPKFPAILRVELAHLLREEEKLDFELTKQLLGPNHPSGLRLLAAEALLLENPRQLDAIEVLKEIARQPNRELALTTASIVQRCLRIDLGLPWGQPLPSPHSRQAAEVTRRVMAWAMQMPMSTGSHASLSSDPALAIEVPPPPPPTDRSNPLGWDF